MMERLEKLALPVKLVLMALLVLLVIQVILVRQAIKEARDRLGTLVEQVQQVKMASQDLQDRLATQAERVQSAQTVLQEQQERLAILDKTVRQVLQGMPGTLEKQARQVIPDLLVPPQLKPDQLDQPAIQGKRVLRDLKERVRQGQPDLPVARQD